MSTPPTCCCVVIYLDKEPARYERAAVRRHARLCQDARLTLAWRTRADAHRSIGVSWIIEDAKAPSQRGHSRSG